MHVHLGCAGAAAKPETATSTGRFNVHEIAASFPEKSDKMLIDHYMTDTEAASARVFRIYNKLPAHHHKQCDEYLYVVSGRGTFWMEDPSTQEEFAPGHLLHFKKNIVHSLPDILEHPLVFMSLDTPRRDQKDIHFEDPSHGSADSFGHGQSSSEL